MANKRRLVAALACRNQGSRLYGKPLQNLDIKDGVSILDNIVGCLKSIPVVDEIVLGISEGVDNEVFKDVAKRYGIKHIVGDQKDVLSRLVACGRAGGATDVFRVTTESPFMHFEFVEREWAAHVAANADATFLDDAIDGCGFEIISQAALERSHNEGEPRHRSEFCTLFIRENAKTFTIRRVKPDAALFRRDLRLTVDTPEDLIVCRAVYRELKQFAPRIPVERIVQFLDANPALIRLTAPLTESGYATMYL